MAINWKQKLLILADFNLTWIGFTFKIIHLILIIFNKFSDISLLVTSHIWLISIRNITDCSQLDMDWGCEYDKLDCCNRSHDELMPVLFRYQDNFIRLWIFFVIGCLIDIIFILHQWMVLKHSLLEYKSGEIAIVSFISRLQLLLLQAVPTICIALMFYKLQSTNPELNCAYCKYNRHQINGSECSMISNQVQNARIFTLKIISTLLITVYTVWYITVIIYRCSRHNNQIHVLRWWRTLLLYLLAFATSIAIVSINYVPITLTYLSENLHFISTSDYFSYLSSSFIGWITATGFIAIIASSFLLITVITLFLTCRCDSTTVINALMTFLAVVLMPLIAYTALLVHFKVLVQVICYQKAKKYSESHSPALAYQNQASES